MSVGHYDSINSVIITMKKLNIMILSPNNEYENISETVSPVSQTHCLQTCLSLTDSLVPTSQQSQPTIVTANDNSIGITHPCRYIQKYLSVKHAR
jgi:hypothetical protein